MRIIYFLIIIFLLLGCTNKEFKSILKPTVKIDNTTYFDNREIDIEAWLSYYTWKLNNEGYESALKVLPDSNAVEPEVWTFIKTKSNTFDQNISSLTGQPIGYFCRKCDTFIKYDEIVDGSVDEPGLCPFLRFPITGITFEQANEFCRWRSKLLGKGEVIFRLPTEIEWKKFALKGLSKKEKSQGFRDSIYTNGCPMYNYNFKNPCERFNKGNLATSRQIGVVRFMQEKSGAYDVYGNVSEMIATKGLSKGGNYLTFAQKCHVDSVQQYKKPEIWLGFRCIGEIKK